MHLLEYLLYLAHHYPHIIVNVLSVFSPNAGKYGPEKTPYLDTFHAVGVVALWYSEASPNLFIGTSIVYGKKFY